MSARADTFPHLAKAPIIEGLIAIHAKLDGDLPVSRLTEFSENVRPDYPTVKVCRRLFARICGSSSSTKEWIAFDTAPGGRMSPYLTQGSEYNVHKKIVRFSAFMPPKSLRKSVYWTGGMSEVEIWSIGDTFVAPSRGPIHGRAGFNSYSMSTNIRELAIAHV